jgi:hypothetical protein
MDNSVEVIAIWSLPLQTGPRWGGTKYAVPPNRRDKVAAAAMGWVKSSLVMFSQSEKVGKV